MNNILCSSMLETLKLITLVPFNPITAHIKEDYEFWDIYSNYFKQIAQLRPAEGKPV